MELVSIGLATYNGQKYIKEAIGSLLHQTHKNFELIISDDLSSDETQKICQDFAKKDSRIRYFKQKKRLGFASNFNFVLKKAHGKYFMWAGQDDLWDTNYIKTLLNLFQDCPEAVSAVSNYQNLFAGKRYNVTTHDFNNECIDTFHSLLHFIKTNNLSYFYGLHKTDMLKKIGGYQIDSRPFFKSSDYLTIFKICLAGPLAFSNKVLFFKRDTGNFTNRFTLLEQHKLTENVRSSILRYVTFPISFIYDFFYSIQYVIQSSFRKQEYLFPTQKLMLIFFILLFFIKRNLQFMLSIFAGLVYFTKGFMFHLDELRNRSQ